MTDDWSAPLRDGPSVLVTGIAGFIGFHLAVRLLEAGVGVHGFDNLNPYYDVGLKRARLAELARFEGFAFTEGDLADRAAVARLFDEVRPRHVVHLAAQAGVRHSIEHPFDYVDSNLTGFLTILEGCRHTGVAHLVYASSSSVYGGNTRMPFSTDDPVDHPVSLYAATKKAGEAMAHSYSHLYGVPMTGLRFFTVYGPWGRPDMAYWLFTEAIWEGRPVYLNNNGDMARDFTYVDDIVEAVVRLIAMPAQSDPAFDRADPRPSTSWAPHRIYNIGAAHPEQLPTVIDVLERTIGKPAERRYRPMPAGDVKETRADVSALEAAVGFRPRIRLEDGLSRFVDWYRHWRGNR